MSENQLVIEGVTVNRKNYLAWVAADSYDENVPVGYGVSGGTYDQLASYVARGIARRRGEQVVTLRHDATSLSGGERDAEVYELTTGEPSKWGGYDINYRGKWLYIQAADVAVVEGWQAAG